MKKASLLTLLLIGFLVIPSVIEAKNSKCDPKGKDGQCGSRTTCKKIGSIFLCTCKTGYQAKGNACEDVNECSQKVIRQECKATAAICQNNLGSYECKCRKGFEMDPLEQQCVDYDECEHMQLCHEKAICENTVGSFKCACAVGFAGDGLECVTDKVYLQKKKIQLIIIIGGSAGGGALLIIALIAFCYFARKKKKKDGEKIEKKESTLSEYGHDWESSDSSEDDDDQ